MDCTVADCEKPARAKGLCVTHYNRQWANAHPDYQRKPSTIPCSIEGCDSLVLAKKLCGKHYTRTRVHNDPHKVLRAVGTRARPTKRQKDSIYARDVPEYSAWVNMKSRCYNPNDKRYYRYGGRGITMYDRWRESFWNFLEDMGSKPTPLHTIDRENNNGNYEPSNCKWSTVREQNANRSNSRPTPGVWSHTYKDGVTKWFVTLKVGKVWVYRDSFYSEEEAINARKQAEQQFLTGL